MNIRINKIKLTNFKCFRDKPFDFNGNDVTISGRNGEGKTTIADAILFCLFGKNSQDQTKFDIKTHDEHGNIIPHLDHAVELELSVCDVDCCNTVTLKHSVKEKWTKKRGTTDEVFSGDTHEYYVNGDLYTANDYKKYIASLIDEQTFRILTNPSYFTSLKWQEQRDILTKMVGDIEPDESNEEFVAFEKQIAEANETFVSYKKHLSYKIKKIKDALDKIPVRLEEQDKALPEKQDWDGIEECIAKDEAEMQKVEDEILSIKSGYFISDSKRLQIAETLSGLYSKKRGIERNAEDAYNEARQKKEREINEYASKFSSALNDQRMMEQTIIADERLIERAKETDYEAELQKLRDQWPSSKFTVNPDLAFCPTCGQHIPHDQYMEKVDEMRNNFNLAREAKIKELNEKAARIKKEQAEAAEELKSLEKKLSDDKAKLIEIKESINDIHSQKNKVEKVDLPDVESVLQNDKDYQTILADIKAAESDTKPSPVSEKDEERLKELNEAKALYKDKVEAQKAVLSVKPQYDKILSIIADIKKEQKDLITQLSELEKKEDLARRYEDHQNEILEEKINEHFKLSRWKMFRTVVNGGDSYNEPYCECYDLNGTAYHDGLNQAARLNIGLDICNTMSRIYNTSAPVIIDQAESTLCIIQTIGQQIRLKVSDTNLKIE